MKNNDWTAEPDLILDYSGLCDECGLTRCCKGSEPIRFSSLEGTNCYVDESSYSYMRKALASKDYQGIHWIDTGDYHYATKLFLERIPQPFSVVLVDHHPDMQRPTFPVLSCGSWLRDCLDEQQMLQSATVVGISPELAAECADYPGRVFVHPESPEMQSRSSALADSIATSLPKGIPVYISIDKDAFSRDFARTDWDQGSMSLDFCIGLVERVARSHKIIGADICGAITRSKGASDLDFEINNESDRVLVQTISAIISQNKAI